MTRVEPLELFFDESRGPSLHLPTRLAKAYGTLRLTVPESRPWVVGNFASTLDGVVSLEIPGHSGGGEISGSNPNDRLLMGILRAAADAVIVGAGTLRAVPGHVWTAQHAYPSAAEEYRELRRRLGKPEYPLNVIVTSSGQLDLRLPVFSSGQIPVLVVTTGIGARRLVAAGSQPSIRVITAQSRGPLSAKSILNAVRALGDHHLLVVEGGPHLIGSFFEGGCLDELFLTLAPQIAGRDRFRNRPGLVAGRVFAPGHPLWGLLVGVRRGGSHLFLRFSFEATRSRSFRSPSSRKGDS